MDYVIEVLTVVGVVEGKKFRNFYSLPFWLARWSFLAVHMDVQTGMARLERSFIAFQMNLA